MNLYYNKSITKTRGCHIDSMVNLKDKAQEIKCFIYLQDVMDLRYGPYMYLPKSHSRSYIYHMYFQRFMNCIWGRYPTDMTYFPVEKR